jgi:hypothetical protein
MKKNIVSIENAKDLIIDSYAKIFLSNDPTETEAMRAFTYKRYLETKKNYAFRDEMLCNLGWGWYSGMPYNVEFGFDTVQYGGVHFLLDSGIKKIIQIPLYGPSEKHDMTLFGVEKIKWYAKKFQFTWVEGETDAILRIFLREDEMDNDFML